MSELIDRKRFSADMRDFQNRVGIWRDEAEDTETRTRADAALATIIETKLILDKQPTVAAASPWHKVEEELPDDTRDVLAVRRYGNDLEKQEVIVAHLSVIMDMKRGFDKWWNATNITHWMPFPEPPKEEE